MNATRSPLSRGRRAFCRSRERDATLTLEGALGMIGSVMRLSRTADVTLIPSPRARLHPPSDPAIGRGLGRGGLYCIRLVPLPRRSGHLHGRPGPDPGRPGTAALGLGPRPAVLYPVRAL